MPKNYGLIFKNLFAELPQDFYTPMAAEGVAEKAFLIHFNHSMLAEIGLDPAAITDSDFTAYFSGRKNLLGSSPLAMVYAGHQFGIWAGQLGDGRALLSGQIQGKTTPLWDIHLKGSGKTPYSRMGDGRAVLRSCIREYLCAEAVHGLGIPTTRSLCLLGTGQGVLREKWEPGAILVRLAPSHIRFGHFEHFFAKERPDLIKLLADHVIKLYFGDISYRDWFADIVRRTAKLIAQWQSVGFAHGVMNTDNMSILGLTLDYGPFGFMEKYDPNFICNHSDRHGRYAFNQQPAVALWNLQVLAYVFQSLIPLETGQEILKNYVLHYNQTYHELMSAKLGIINPQPSDQHLYIQLLQLMQQHGTDYTHTFYLLASAFDESATDDFLNLFQAKENIQSWHQQLRQRLHQGLPGAIRQMRAANPRYVLRNWVAETAIRQAEDHQDYQLIDDLLTVLHRPYDDHARMRRFAAAAPPEFQDLGVSCSS